ncbi:heme lyase CcmF/NrfE family subunit [Pseudaestuariivita rosea]|uniref:heme lyase CcmF/NrfE family subunit n=1 Tax=Pseudaestuariivita rosea TaxID=2763263 RepID=UPI001ABA7BB2|nr:heme lyase CcmF/NrfE family subunit [Pseudaestuariivita rosea]
MITELGHFALILAFAVAVVQMVVPLAGAMTKRADWMAVAEPAATAQFLLTAFSFAALTYAFVVSDFSLQLVTLNSHTDKPMIYKITGVWGNHEGSMLLWVLILTLFGAMAAWFGGNLPPTLRARVLAVQSSIAVAFFAFIIFTSNPFWRLAIPPFNGQDLNPLLQDPGLAFHPPFLYLGYVGLSMSFSFAVAALMEGRVDAAWGRWVRPWTLTAWLFLTIGIALGSWWAYYELGWGGFWFWDPVENASFMPWLIAAALLHSAIVVEKREALKSWTILLAILAFGFSLIGAFIVRSGVLTSVHAFANDPERGVYLLIITGVFTGGALVLFAIRASAMEAKGVFGSVSRETGLIVNNILLAVSCFVVFVGTMWPLLADILWERKLSVGPPFFNQAFTPFMVLLALALPIGSLLPWKRGRLERVIPLLVPALILSIALAALAFAIQTGRSALGPIGVALGIWLIAGTVTELWQRAGKGGVRLQRLRGLPRADWGKAVAHSGLGITMFGVAALMAWELEDIRIAQIGDRFSVGIHDIELRDVRRERGPNYVTTKAEMGVFRNGREVAVLYPEKRFYPVANMPTTEAAIKNGILRDVYLVIGDPQQNGGWAVRTYIKPFANWIWAGSIIMALGGALSLSDRRHRVAAGARRIAAPDNAVPAE